MNIGEECKEFHKWLNETFDWIDNDAKRLMYKSWLARAKVEDKKQQQSVQ